MCAYPFETNTAFTPKEKFNAVLDLRHDYRFEAGEALATALLLEKNIHVCRALVSVVFPIWLPIADKIFVDAGLWPIEPQLTQTVVWLCRRHRIHSFLGQVGDWAKSNDINKRIAATFYVLFHEGLSEETYHLISELLGQLDRCNERQFQDDDLVIQSLIRAKNAHEKGEPYVIWTADVPWA